MSLKPGSKKKAGPSARPTRAARRSNAARAASASPSTANSASTAIRPTEPVSLFSTTSKLSDGDPESLSLDEVNRITIHVAEFLMDRGFPSFRYNETLNGLRRALTEQFEFIGIRIPDEKEFSGHTQWWKLRDYTIALDAIRRNEK